VSLPPQIQLDLMHEIRRDLDRRAALQAQIDALPRPARRLDLGLRVFGSRRWRTAQPTFPRGRDCSPVPERAA
jgi:hypothetical protein